MSILIYHFIIMYMKRIEVPYPIKNVKMPKKHDKNMSIFDFIAKT